MLYIASLAKEYISKMNLFRLLGDLSHLFAIILLVVKVVRTKSCAGLSGKAQVLYLLVFGTRYLDLFSNFISVYNTTLKILFILLTTFTIYLIYWRYKKTYDRKNEPQYVEVILIPCFVLAIFINHEFSVMEILWTFSIYLESVAILPQLFMISKTGKAESITASYLLFLGAYRALYLLNWVYRYYYEGFFDLLAIAGGVVQTLVYCDFFYVYFTRSAVVELVGENDGKLDITNI